VGDYFKVISTDPGEKDHCGIVIANGVGSSWDIEYIDAITKKQLFDILEKVSPEGTLLIYEDYKLYDSKKSAMVGNKFETVKVIGTMEYICSRRNIDYIVSQTMNKKFFDNNKLKRMGLYTEVEHKRDAVRHLLYYLYFTAKLLPLADLVGKNDT